MATAQSETYPKLLPFILHISCILTRLIPDISMPSTRKRHAPASSKPYSPKQGLEPPTRRSEYHPAPVKFNESTHSFPGNMFEDSASAAQELGAQPRQLTSCGGTPQQLVPVRVASGEGSGPRLEMFLGFLGHDGLSADSWRIVRPRGSKLRWWRFANSDKAPVFRKEF